MNVFVIKLCGSSIFPNYPSALVIFLSSLRRQLRLKSQNSKDESDHSFPPLTLMMIYSFPSLHIFAEPQRTKNSHDRAWLHWGQDCFPCHYDWWMQSLTPQIQQKHRKLLIFTSRPFEWDKIHVSWSWSKSIDWQTIPVTHQGGIWQIQKKIIVNIKKAWQF